MHLPSSFLPAEDQGYFITNIQLPVGAAQERTDEVLQQVEEYFLKQPEIESFITVAGFSFNGRGQNSALSFGRLKDWSKRKGAEHTVQAVIARAAGKFSAVKDAIIFPLNPPAINELGNSTGFDLQLQDLAGLGHEKLLAARNQLAGNGRKESARRGRARAGPGRRRATENRCGRRQSQRARRVAWRTSTAPCKPVLARPTSTISSMAIASSA